MATRFLFGPGFAVPALLAPERITAEFRISANDNRDLLDRVLLLADRARAGGECDLSVRYVAIAYQLGELMLDAPGSLSGHGLN